jgi:hypothetical protein
MTIQFDCPSCGIKVRAPEASVGKKGKCPGCQNVFQVPEPVTESKEVGSRVVEIDDEAPEYQPQIEGPETKHPARSTIRRPADAGRHTRVIVGGILVGFCVLIVGFAALKMSRGGRFQWQAKFDPNSLENTGHWILSECQKMKDVSKKGNELLSEQAEAALNRELATAEGKDVRWQARVLRVTATSVFLAYTTALATALGEKDDRNHMSAVARAHGADLDFGDIDLDLPDGVEFEVFIDDSPDDTRPASSTGFPITADQARKLVRGDSVTFTGRVHKCRSSRGPGPSGRSFVLILVHAKVVN